MVTEEKRHRPPLLITWGRAGLCALTLLIWAPAASAGPQTMCVATLKNLSAGAEMYWLGHFISDSIAKNLGVLQGFKIILAADGANSSTAACRGDSSGFRVDGDFSYDAGAVVVRTRCAPGGVPSASAEASFVSSMADMYPHMADLSVTLAGFSGVDYSHSELSQIRRSPTLSAEAITYYAKALASPSQSEERGLWLLRAISADPSYTDALSKLGIHYYTTSRIPEALIVLERLLTVDPDYPYLYYNLGLIQRALGDYAEAVDMYRMAVAARPLDSDAWNNLGASHYLTGDSAKAVAAFEQTLTLDPDNPRARANLLAASRASERESNRKTNRQSDVERLVRLVDTGAALYADGDYTRALKESEKALEIDPDNFNANNNAGLACLELGEFQKADIHFQQALRADPSADSVRQNLARLERALKNMNRAQERPVDPGEKIVDPAQKARAMRAAGRIHLARGSYDKAVDMFERALKFAPDETGSIIGLGRAYFGLAEYEMAREQFSLAAELDRDNEEAKTLVSETTYVLDGNLDGGPERRRGLSEIEARASVVRGVWLSAEEKFSESKAEYLRALDFSPALVEALNNLAYVYQRLGQRDLARAALKKAWLLDPENETNDDAPYEENTTTDSGDGTLEERTFQIFVPGAERGVDSTVEHSEE